MCIAPISLGIRLQLLVCEAGSRHMAVWGDGGKGGRAGGAAFYDPAACRPPSVGCGLWGDFRLIQGGLCEQGRAKLVFLFPVRSERDGGVTRTRPSTPRSEAARLAAPLDGQPLAPPPPPPPPISGRPTRAREAADGRAPLTALSLGP